MKTNGKRMAKIAQQQQKLAEEHWDKFKGIEVCPFQPLGYTGMEPSLIGQMMFGERR